MDDKRDVFHTAFLGYVFVKIMQAHTLRCVKISSQFLNLISMKKVTAHILTVVK